MHVLPEGTVTFLFTDIEGSTELLKALGDKYAQLLEDQRRIVRASFEKYGGQEVDTQGDSFFVSFPRATQAVSAAVQIQQEIHKHKWPKDVDVRLRMGLHTGEPLTWAEGYVGIDVHRAARIAAVGHGGQVLLSQTTTPLIQDSLPDGVSLLDLGRHRLKDLRSPERLGQLAIEGLPSEFPPLNSLERLADEIPLELKASNPPPFLKEGAEPPPRPTFVVREAELAWLSERLERALEGEGQLAFVAGGPGRGKSALLEEFMRRSMAEYPDLLAIRGECSAHTGVGDPYQPFRGALSMLLGDLEGAWASGILSPETAQRLWEAMPRAAHLLLEVAVDLLESFVSGRTLHTRLKSAIAGGSGLLDRLGRQIDAERRAPGELGQRSLFEQVEGLLIELTATHPLILVLDDLQWADSGSINLLFHLMRRLKGRRLMILGAYRPAEVAIGRGDEQHPLEKLLSEAKRLHGEITVDLSTAEQTVERAFIEAYIDTEPNALGEDFRQALADHTEGHPLFTVELLRAMQERGDLIRDEKGRWIEGERLDWETLPARVEGVIEERIGRLEEELRETLTIASVEGETFTAQVVAQVQAVGERMLLKRLSQQLEKQHRLIQGGAESKVGEKLLSLYRFSHALYQRYLYNELSPGERRMLHRDVSGILEKLYEGQEDSIVVQLAHHWEQAGDVEKAEGYLQRAGDKARLSFAHETAVSYYQRAIRISKQQQDWDRAARSLMKLGLSQQMSFDYERARKSFLEAFELWNSTKLAAPSIEGYRGETLRYAWGEPLTIDPGKCGEVWGHELINHIFCGLVKITPDLSITPELAQSWEVMDEGRRMLFHLAADIFWSDGTRITAGDFEFAWKRNLHPRMFKNPAQLLYEVAGGEAYHLGANPDADSVGVKALDDRTLEVILENNCGYILYLLANHSVTYPLPRHIIETQGDQWTDLENLVSNGPFMLQEWVEGESALFARNPYYHKRIQGNVDQIEVTFKDPLRSLERYEEDQSDMVALPYSHQEAKHAHLDEYIVAPVLFTDYILINCTQHPLSETKVRQALALAIDKKAGSDLIRQGYLHPALGGLVPPPLSGSLPEAGQQYDPQRAASLMTASGFTNGVGFPELTLTTFGSSFELEKWLVTQWKKILGINIHVEIAPWGEYVERGRAGRFALAYSGWTADYPDPDSFLRTNITLFQGGWEHSEFNEIIVAARASQDQMHRKKLYQDAERIILDQVPVIPLSHGRRHWLVKPWVRVFHISPLGTIHASEIIIEPH